MWIWVPLNQTWIRFWSHAFSKSCANICIEPYDDATEPFHFFWVPLQHGEVSMHWCFCKMRSMPQMPIKDVSFPTAMLAAEMISFSLATTGLQQRINFLYNATFLEGSQTSSTCPQLLKHKAEVSLMLVFMTLLMGTMSLAQVGRGSQL